MSDLLVTMKESINGKPIKQHIMSEPEALQFIRRAMQGLEPVEESSADLRAMGFIDAALKMPRVIENKKNGHVVIVHKYNKIQ